MSKPSNLKAYLENQMLEMLKHKWIKGVHLGKDPGEEACREWIDKHASAYRKDFQAFFDEVVELVVNNCRKSLPEEVNNCCNEEAIKKMAFLFIQEFTNVWLMERLKPCPNKHAGEV